VVRVRVRADAGVEARDPRMKVEAMPPSHSRSMARAATRMPTGAAGPVTACRLR
jgi:hypothetical protein